jgi:hypothetical protein
MALGKGIHTTYYDNIPASSKKSLLEKLFFDDAVKKQNPFVNHQYDKEAVIAVARTYMFGYDTKFVQGSSQLKPDASRDVNPMFPKGVNLAFQGAEDVDIQPSVGTVKWEKAGDPANPYVPDVRSPGASGNDSVNLAPQDSDPSITPGMIKPVYIVGTDGTRAPTETGKSIHTAVAEEKITLGQAFEGEWKS